MNYDLWMKVQNFHEAHSQLSGSSWEEFSMYCSSYLKCALSWCDPQVIPCSSQYAQDLPQSVCCWNMVLTWQTLALSFQKAVRTGLTLRYFRLGLSRGKGGPSNRKMTLTEHFLLSLKSSATITSHLNRQNLSPNFFLKYELMLCKQTVLQMCLCKIIHPVFVSNVPTLLVIQTVLTAVIVLNMDSSSAAARSVSWVACLKTTASAPQLAEAHNTSWCPHKHIQGERALLKRVCDLPYLSLRTFPNEENPFFAPSVFLLGFIGKDRHSPLCMKWMHLKQNCSVNLVLIQDHSCRYLST